MDRMVEGEERKDRGNQEWFVPFPLTEDRPGFQRSVASKLAYSVGKDPDTADRYDWYTALCLVLRDRLFDRWHDTQKRIRESGSKKVHYLSLEFLIGRSLTNAAVNLDLDDTLRELLMEVGASLEDVASLERDAGLGNGGLGRLAACYLDSMATLDLAGFGYGIRYDYGLFRQEIGSDGEQIEKPNTWLRYRNVWEIKREQIRYDVKFGGHCVAYLDEDQRVCRNWASAQVVEAVAYDTPIPGNNGETVNHLRLWGARHKGEIDLGLFNRGDHLGALQKKAAAENISNVLYPDDSTEEGKLLRIKQEFFLVSASLQDIVHGHLSAGFALEELPGKATIQLNDTHPALAIPELMRLLCDEHGLNWDVAWDITRRTFNYTNHTLLPEALESWPVSMLEAVVPRHLEIIYQINREFLDEVEDRFPGDFERRRRMSIIDDADHGVRSARMGWLATIGSQKVNGVAELHSRLVKETIFRDFDEFYPGKFVNVTNGVTPRRWIKGANPNLAKLITDRIGRSWENDLGRLQELAGLADDEIFRSEFAAVKQANKDRLAEVIHATTGINVDPGAMFDVQIKRIHEYKRQLLNVLHVLTLYHRIRANPDAEWLPRVVIFAGKAAAAYTVAKWVIQLINNVADVVNKDPLVEGKLKVVFMPDYSVSLAEVLIPASDLSEQISTAGMEASGTGNMKFAMNGAVTIGTLDGANVEILEEVGEENIFIFGLSAEEVSRTRAHGYRPLSIARNNNELGHILHQISDGFFNPGDLHRFKPLVDRLLDEGEYFLVLADYESYLEAQSRVETAYRDREGWIRKAILNTAHMGKFSSDRAVQNYADRIWNLSPIG